MPSRCHGDPLFTAATVTVPAKGVERFAAEYVLLFTLAKKQELGNCLTSRRAAEHTMRSLRAELLHALPPGNTA
jgi:hypothetical protein